MLHKITALFMNKIFLTVASLSLVASGAVFADFNVRWATTDAPKCTTAGTTITCTTSSSPTYTLIIENTDPSLTKRVSQIEYIFNTSYPFVIQHFAHDAAKAPTTITIDFVATYNGATVSATQTFPDKNLIVVNPAWLTASSVDMSWVARELTHIVLKYTASCGDNNWVAEALATYSNWSYAPVGDDVVFKDPGAPSSTTTTSYKNDSAVGARFLVWLQKTYNDLPEQVNRACQNGSDLASTFQILTGQTLDQLWTTYLEDTTFTLTLPLNRDACNNPISDNSTTTSCAPCSTIISSTTNTCSTPCSTTTGSSSTNCSTPCSTVTSFTGCKSCPQATNSTTASTPNCTPCSKTNKPGMGDCTPLCPNTASSSDTTCNPSCPGATRSSSTICTPCSNASASSTAPACHPLAKPNGNCYPNIELGDKDDSTNYYAVSALHILIDKINLKANKQLYDYGSDTTTFGTATDTAVREFQKTLKTEIFPGLVNPVIWHALGACGSGTNKAGPAPVVKTPKSPPAKTPKNPVSNSGNSGNPSSGGNSGNPSSSGSNQTTYQCIITVYDGVAGTYTPYTWPGKCGEGNNKAECGPPYYSNGARHIVTDCKEVAQDSQGSQSVTLVQSYPDAVADCTQGEYYVAAIYGLTPMGQNAEGCLDPATTSAGYICQVGVSGSIPPNTTTDSNCAVAYTDATPYNLRDSMSNQPSQPAPQLVSQPALGYCQKGASLAITYHGVTPDCTNPNTHMATMLVRWGAMIGPKGRQIMTLFVALIHNGHDLHKVCSYESKFLQILLS